MSILTKRWLSIGGRAVPGIQISPAETRQVQTRAGKTIPVQFAEVLSLRETNPANGPVVQYLRVTPENLGFTTLRFNEVEGLDVENGSHLSIEVLEARRLTQIMARQEEFAASGPALQTTGIDLSQDDDEDAPAGDPAPA